MDLDELMDSDDDVISEAATIVAMAQQGLVSGELTQEQFEELTHDALEIDKMAELANDLERKIMFKKAVDVFKLVLGAIPK